MNGRCSPTVSAGLLPVDTGPERHRHGSKKKSGKTRTMSDIDHFWQGSPEMVSGLWLGTRLASTKRWPEDRRRWPAIAKVRLGLSEGWTATAAPVPDGRANRQWSQPVFRHLTKKIHVRQFLFYACDVEDLGFHHPYFKFHLVTPLSSFCGTGHYTIMVQFFLDFRASIHDQLFLFKARELTLIMKIDFLIFYLNPDG